MIRYTLKCDNAHRFESWFQSGAAYEKLRAKRLISCPDCDSTIIEKTIMAPRVQTGQVEAPNHDLTHPETTKEKALAELRQKVESESEYVGLQFASEARAIHDGDAPERAIYGEAKPQEALDLIKDGVKVAPLPFIPVRKTN